MPGLVSGFTLIETMVAISIVTIAIVGPLLTADRTLVAAYTARDQLTASYLASEAIEYVRFLRDDVYLVDYKAEPADPTLPIDSFNDFVYGSQAASITSCVGAGDGSTLCTLADPLAANIGVGGTGYAIKACGASCPPLYLNSGRYTTASGGTSTTFVRTLQFYYPDNNELDVVVTVSWMEHGTVYKTLLSEYLSPWQ